LFLVIVSSRLGLRSVSIVFYECVIDVCLRRGFIFEASELKLDSFKKPYEKWMKWNTETMIFILQNIKSYVKSNDRFHFIVKARPDGW